VLAEEVRKGRVVAGAEAGQDLTLVGGQRMRKGQGVRVPVTGGHGT
jgi:hypothetical protein